MHYFDFSSHKICSNITCIVFRYCCGNGTVNLKRSTDSFLIGQTEKDIPSGKLPTRSPVYENLEVYSTTRFLQDLEYQILPEAKLRCTSLNEFADKVFA